MPKKRPLTPVTTYDRNAVLDINHVAAGLGCARDKAEKMDLPFFYVGARRKYLWGQVLDTLADRAKNGDTKRVA